MGRMSVLSARRSARREDLGLAPWEFAVLRRLSNPHKIQAWLNDTLLLTSRDTRLRNGRVGLWTTNDSNTAFDDLTIRGMTAVSEGAR